MLLDSIIATVAASACPIFPASFSTNRPVTGLPVLPNSDALVQSIGSDTGVHPDFGTIYGIPFDKVNKSTPRTKISHFQYPDESDHVRYPIPNNVHIESGGGDRHGILVDTKACKLYELFALERSGSGWKAGSGAVWNMRSKKLRPAGWTSADAAGLPIYPLLARYKEMESGTIHHALRMTVEDSRSAYVYPARHQAGSDDPSLPRMGERFRLKASVDISGLPRQAKIVAQAMKTYGLIVADNGSNWYVSGAPDKRWSDDDLHSLGELHGSDFEAVDASSLK
ncbi:MAG: hypothetical protein QOF76_616 [Solirubrobacteraceae bacterium]|jgi:hypothetical protein|nr:hypothetical protein [Solirubrobacteraceae bacterium]